MEKGKLLKAINNPDDKLILIIGDVIIDQFHVGRAIGKSSEAPVIVMKEDRVSSYVGGAGIVARNIKSLGGNPHLLSVVGNDDLGKRVINAINLEKVPFTIVTDKNRPTTLKQRYVADKQKLLRVSKLSEEYISKEIEKSLLKKIKTFQNISTIIISDFSYGVITVSLLKSIKIYAKKKNIKLYGDSQSSSQIGDIMRFKNYDLITPTEREARIALNDEHSPTEQLIQKLYNKLKVKKICLTMGSDGFIISTKKERYKFSAINETPVDTMGAGDTLLACLAIWSNHNLKIAGQLANIIVSIAISKLGNIPVMKKEVIEYVKKM